MKLHYQPLPHTDASQLVANLPVVTRAVYDQLLPELKGLAFVITGLDSAVQLQAARDAIARLPLGANYDDVRKDIIDALPWTGAKAERRADLLLRHWGGVAYATMQYQVNKRQADVFPYWQYASMGDGRVRATHQALDGIILPHDSPFWARHLPPWEPLCRCTVIPLMQADVDQIRADEAHLPPDQHSVLDGPLRRKLEEEDTLVRGPSLVFNTAPPQGWHGWNPDNLTTGVSLAEIQRKLSPDVFQEFTQFLQAKWIDPTRSVWQWLNAKPPTPPQSSPAKPAAPAPVAPAPATPPRSIPASSARTDQLSARMDVKIRDKARKAAVATALDHIASVHSDGGLLTSPVDGSSLGPGTHGQYHGVAIAGKVSKSSITIAPQSTNPVKTFLHETGHKIDHEMLLHAVSPPADPASLHASRNAILASLRAAQTQQQIVTSSSGVFTRYYLSDVEIWARAYAQYILTRAGDHASLKEPGDWTADEFSPVLPHFDSFFQSLGWAKPTP